MTFKILNSLFYKSRHFQDLCRKKNTPRGQISLVIIFITAIIFIFFAVVLNLARVSQIKNVTTMAANGSAAYMASQYAGYAEQLYQHELGGDDDDGAGDDLTICGPNPRVVARIGAIILAVALAAAAQGHLGMFLLKVVGKIGTDTFLLVAGALAISLQREITVVTPKYIDLLNKQLALLSSPQTQVVERGIQFALQEAVSDTKLVSDIHDIDQDGRFELSGEAVGRFSHFYSQRVSEFINVRVAQSTVENFLRRLEMFLYGESRQYSKPNDPPRGEAFWDDILGSCLDKRGYPLLPDCSKYPRICLPDYCPDPPLCFPNYYCLYVWPRYLNGNKIYDQFVSRLGDSPYLSQVYNFCCLPDGTGPWGEPKVRPACCDKNPPSDPADPYCGTATTCPPDNTTTSIPTDIVYTFDPYFDNDCNTIDDTMFGQPLDKQCINSFTSLRELLGRDDEDRFRRTWPPRDQFALQAKDPLKDYRKADSVGPLFPSLWDVSNNISLGEKNCFWCDSCDLQPGVVRDDKSRDCREFCDPEQVGDPLYLRGIKLAGACTGFDCCAYFDKADPVLSKNQFKLDTVRNIDAVTDMNIIKKNNADKHRCYDCKSYISQCNGARPIGWWKDGSDQYCSPAWPYYVNCPGKHCPDSCGLGPDGPTDPCKFSPTDPTCNPDDVCFMNSDATKDRWREDQVDEIVNASDRFISWANSLLSKDIGLLTLDFIQWFPEAWLWVTPDRYDGSAPLEIAGRHAGILGRWMDFMGDPNPNPPPALAVDDWQDSLNDWLSQDTQATADDKTYCFPKESCVKDPNYATYPDPNCGEINNTVVTSFDPSFDPSKVEKRDHASITEVNECLSEYYQKILPAYRDQLEDCWNYCTTHNPPADTIDPEIVNPFTVNATDNSFTITWNTSEPTNARIEYWTGSSPHITTPLDPYYRISHSVTITGLLPTTNYEFIVLGSDMSQKTLSNPGPYSFPTEPGYGLSADRRDYNIGETITVTWAASSGATASDWVGLYEAGGSILLDHQIPSGFSGDLFFSTAGRPQKNYEFRYYKSGATLAVTSPSFWILNPADTTPPVVTNLTEIFLTPDQALITWTTDEPATSEVTYWEANSGVPQIAPPDMTLVTDHVLVLDSLKPLIVYNYEVTSANKFGIKPPPGTYTGILRPVEVSYCPSPPAKKMTDPVTQCQPTDPYVADVLDRLEKTRNAIEKFQVRYNFLDNLLTNVNNIVGALSTHAQRIFDFINSDEVRKLKEEFEVVRDPWEEQSLPAVVIYAWQSDPPKGKTKGYWHFVRVDTMAPGRCENNCGRIDSVKNPAGSDPSFPYLLAYSKSGGTENCTSLGDSFNTFTDGSINTVCNENQLGGDGTGEFDDASDCFQGGTVKVRVIRYDEEKDSNLFTFANNIPIWDFISYHPLRGGAKDLIRQMEDPLSPHYCNLADGKLTVGYDDARDPVQTRAGAFMLNQPSLQPGCWVIANKILERGTMSYSCAQYYFHPRDKARGVRGGFGIKFVKCDEPFIKRSLSR